MKNYFNSYLYILGEYKYATIYRFIHVNIKLNLTHKKIILDETKYVYIYMDLNK